MSGIIFGNNSVVQAQQAEINLLKSKLNELLIESGRETI